MVTVGVVKSLSGGSAKVLLEADASCCDHCAKETCDINAHGVETEAVNLAHAKVGQKVKVEMKTFTYLKGALILYVLPVLALLAGAFLGDVYLPEFFDRSNPDLLSAAGGFLLFLLSLILVKFLSGRMERKTEHKSVIEEIIEG
jgi:sigma-E factor negative regulatory protein RseC